MLDHKYPSADLSFAHLKGVDQARVEELRKACEGKGFYLYLASIEKTVSGSAEDEYYGGYNNFGYNADCDHPIVDVCDSSLRLLRVGDRRGRTVAEQVDIDETIFVQNDVFDRAPDQEEFEQGYTGNEGSSATHFYRETVCFLLSVYSPPCHICGLGHGHRCSNSTSS